MLNLGGVGAGCSSGGRGGLGDLVNTEKMISVVVMRNMIAAIIGLSCVVSIMFSL